MIYLTFSTQAAAELALGEVLAYGYAGYWQCLNANTYEVRYW